MGNTIDKFYDFLERMVSVTHDAEGFDREKYVRLVQEICAYYDLAKGDVEFYKNVSYENKKDGNVYCDFDNGKADRILVQTRVVSATQAVIKGTIYVSEDRGTVSDTDKLRIGLLLNLILAFVSRRRLLVSLEQFGFTDLEGYPNFRAFARYLEIHNDRDQLKDKCAFQYDLHNFTMVNEEIGRENGNVVMRNYHRMVAEACGEEGIVCRLGGDKFIGVYPRNREEKVLEILSGVPVTFTGLEERRIFLSAAVGIFRIPEGFVFRNNGDVMDKITMTGAIAKKQEDGAVVFYDEKMKAMRGHMHWVQSKFRRALEAEEFRVYYQPKVNIHTKEIVGAEALCRWFHKDQLIPPLDFIPILEQNTDICDLDFYMLDHVCRDIRRRLDEGRHVVRISVNLSRKHLVDVDLQEHIMSIIDRYDIPYQFIEIELTETTTDVRFRDLKRVVSGLQEQGISMAVDDFGIGYSSLNLIREIPWDVLKIDKCFVPQDDDQSSSITNVMFRHVAALAVDLGMECVVEGIETKKQLEMMEHNFCNIAQGFYFDRPLPVEEFESRLDSGSYE